MARHRAPGLRPPDQERWRHERRHLQSPRLRRRGEDRRPEEAEDAPLEEAEDAEEEEEEEDVEEGEEGDMTLSFERVTRELRLTHALCYASVQGDTKEGSVLLCDVFHRHFTMRHLILGMSRARHGKHVMIDA